MTVSSESKVGIVLVSHSAKLAEAVAELAKQMTQERVPIAIAAGIDDPENPFGTDVLKVQEAIESVYTDAGVVIFMDLGSAIMSAEMAIELLPPAQKNHIKICPAPLIEGAIAAIIQASLGANIQQVIAEANGALMTKSSQLNVDEAIPINIENTQNKDDETPSEKIKITVKNSLGIHARPAAKLVAIANNFSAKISLQNLTKNSHLVNAKSINQVMKLAVKKGDEIEIQATGNKAVDALKAIQELITNNFYEAEVIVKKTPKILTTPDTNNKLVGTPASPGIAIATVVHARAEILEEVEDYPVENSEVEWEYLQLILQTAKQEIQRIIDSLSDQNKSDNNQADIFQAHQLYIEDPTLLEQVHQLIFAQNRCAAVAWKTAIEEMIATYQKLEDPYLQARAIDIKDVGGRVLQLLTGRSRRTLNLSKPGILVAPDLTPSQATQLQPNLVLGICTSAGSVTAHSTLIANMLGIPMVVGVGSQLLSLTPGSQIALDGETGEIWLEPNQAQLQELQAKQAHTSSTFQQPQEAITQDGKKIPLMANILGVADTKLALERGAEGVGLLRTEFLYLERNTAPTEAEEYETYRAIAEILGTRPLTIRTLDIGGDKVLPYIKQESEANPVLGCRGIRESLDNPEILRSQLRAILRVSHGHNIKVMFPMVTSVQEVRAAREILTEVEHSLLELPSFPGVGNIKVGIMIEVPAAAMMADQLAQEVDFFSIGTNDLSQYVMAADRTNSKVAHLADGFEPAVLRMIQQTVIAAHQASISVSVCGQLASSPLAVPILLGLGVDELSVAPPAISTVKKVISQLNGSQVEAIARDVLQLDGAKSVKEYIVGQLGLVIL
ncbi:MULTISPECIES: phosphoenolpyruvate--protein phosphotransferase [Okeania]|uniref:Phosphocarrier protein HPr n=1 Tax=Okeania hirsuta TaxID=1458930 RepID=A0A3N6P6E9_9CYAN|nr:MULTISPECIES: phosphoenolpyruvate--protein phosphotransferase [Okeania]NES90306.1 phosphoenolpyruvate--protein phosphotransferase [Okeania sp. SIO2B9]NET78140.1 phosphoenolpyruvate--protein phosphotransferase [Okeania sp. SIO1F9]RQH29623.1 phosphoenolpyruvate--protein phosphotransferase [Okeania hirsuta]